MNVDACYWVPLGNLKLVLSPLSRKEVTPPGWTFHKVSPLFHNLYMNLLIKFQIGLTPSWLSLGLVTPFSSKAQYSDVKQCLANPVPLQREHPPHLNGPEEGHIMSRKSRLLYLFKKDLEDLAPSSLGFDKNNDPSQ